MGKAPFKPLILVAGLVIATTLGVACQQQTTPSPAAANPAPVNVAPAAKPSSYRIGNLAALTGQQAQIGVSFKNVAEMTAEQINTNGGVDGVKLEILNEDHLADPKQGVVAFTKLASVDKVPVIMSSWSSVVVAMSPAAAENKTVLINYGANSPTLRGAGPYTFSTMPLGDTDVTVLAKYLYNERNTRKLAIIHISDESGRVPATKMKEQFERLGGQVVALESHEPNGMDFGAQLSKIKAANPDAIHIHSMNWESGRIVKQAREMGLSQQFTSYAAVESQQMLDIAGEAATGLIYTTYAPPADRPGVKEFMDRYTAKYGTFPTGSQYALYIADTIQLVTDAIKAINKKGLPYTGENFRQVLADTKEFNTVLTGKTTFQFPGQDVMKPVTLRTVNGKDKKFETLKTIE